MLGSKVSEAQNPAGSQFTSSISKESILLNVFNTDLGDGRGSNRSYNIKMEGVFDTADSCVVIQEKFNKLEKQAEQNLTHLRKGKCKQTLFTSIHWGPIGWKTTLQTRNYAEAKWNTLQQCVLAAKKTNHNLGWARLGRSLPAGQERYCSDLLKPYFNCCIWGFPARETPGHA